MIRIDLGPRLIRRTRKLGPEFSVKLEETLSRVADHFSDPHRHSGLGLRKLGRNSCEIRVWLQWRIVWIKEPDRLTAYAIMDHDEVSAWLKGRKGK